MKALLLLWLIALGGLPAATATVPTATPQTVSAQEDVLAAITLAGSPGSGGALTYRISTLPAHGFLFSDALGTVQVVQGAALAAPAVWYRSNLDGNDVISGAHSGSFAFTVENAAGISAPATVSVDVQAVDDPPWFTPVGTIAMAEDQATALIDVWVHGGPPTALDETADQVALQNVNADLYRLYFDQVLVYWLGGTHYQVSVKPKADINGTYTVPLTALQIVPTESVQLTTFAALTVIITPVADPPVLEANTGITVADDAPVTIGADALRIADPDGEAIYFTLIAAPQHGTLFLDGTVCQVGDRIPQWRIDAGQFAYQRTPGNGVDDAFTLTFNDGSKRSDGTSLYADAGPLTVAVSMAGPRVATDWLGTLAGVAREADLAAANTGGATVAWSLVAAPAEVAVTLLDPARGRIRLVPAAGFTGTVNVTMAVSDGVHAADQRAIPVRVTGLGEARPWALADAPTTLAPGDTLNLEVPWSLADLPGSTTLTFASGGDAPPGLVLTASAADRVQVQWPVPADEPAGVVRSFLVLAGDPLTRASGCWPVLVRILPVPSGVR